MFNNTIRKKLIVGFSIILTILIGSTIYNLYIYNDSRIHITKIQEDTLASYQYATEMKNNIIQVDQFLTDVSATKNVTHLKEADEQYSLFKKNSDGLASLNPEYDDELDTLNSDVDKLYSYGKEMVDMYISSGHENGNKMMAEFDRLADRINSKVDEIQKKSVTSMEDSLMTIRMHMEMNQKIAVALSVVTVFLALFIVFVLSNGITKPLNNFVEIFKDLEKGQGDLTRRINIKTKDEMAMLARLFNNFMDSMENIVLQIKKNSAIVSQGSVLLSEEEKQTADGIATTNVHMSRVAEDTQKINASISHITEGISQISLASHASANDAQQISLEVDNINRLAQESGKVAFDTKIEMERTEEISSNTINVAKELENEAGKIGRIIDTIKLITDQTNLLAINAAIEAARAGEKGKGFGVVAEEIRKLSESTNQSAKTIENMVVNIQEMTQKTMVATTGVGESIKKGSEMVEKVYGELQHIIERVSNITERVQSIAAVAEEQSASTQELSSAMRAINESNNSITASLQEVAASISAQSDTLTGLNTTALDLNRSAEQLSGLISKFKVHEG